MFYSEIMHVRLKALINFIINNITQNHFLFGIIHALSWKLFGQPPGPTLLLNAQIFACFEMHSLVSFLVLQSS